MRKFVCLAALALVGASFAQDVKVTYTTRAVSANQAIAELAAKSGMKIACSPAMASEILVLRLKDAPMAEVMKQIAAVTSGRWVQEGDTQFLVADQGGRQMEASRIQQRFAIKIADTFKKMQEAMKKKDPPKAGDTSPEAIQAAMYGFGQYGSMTKLALAIGPNALSGVPEGGRVVFSTNPTRMQRSLPSTANDIIDEFVAEYNKIAEQAKQAEPAKNEVDPQVQQFLDLIGQRMKKPEAIKTAPAKALVVAERRAMFGGYTLELKLYDTQGKVLADQNMPLAVDSPMFDPQQFINPKPEAPDKSPQIPLSPESKELAGLGGNFGMGGDAGHLKLSKELMAALRDPVSRDPLSFAQSEGLIFVAEQRNEQLVADLPDGLLSFFGNMGKSAKLTTDAFMKDIKGENKTAMQEAGGWLVVSPDNPVQARAQRADRAALKALIDKSQAQGVLRLDDIAAYAQRNGSPMDDAPATANYIMIFAPNAMQQGMMGMTNWDMLRLYGSLAEEQRQALRQGRRIPFGQVAPGAQATLTKMLFGPDGSLIVETPSQKPKQDPLTEMMMEQISRFGSGNDVDFRTEPTEVMPNGLPQDGYISVNFTSEPVGQPQTLSSDLGMGGTVGPFELGLFKFFKEDPNMSQIGGMMPTMDDFRVGTRSVYNFAFYVAPQVCEKETLHDDNIGKDAPVYKITNLPADFQKKIDETAEMMKNNPIWKMIGKMGGFGRQVPPP